MIIALTNIDAPWVLVACGLVVGISLIGLWVDGRIQDRRQWDRARAAALGETTSGRRRAVRIAPMAPITTRHPVVVAELSDAIDTQPPPELERLTRRVRPQAQAGPRGVAQLGTWEKLTTSTPPARRRPVVADDAPTVDLTIGNGDTVPRERYDRLAGHLRFKDTVLRRGNEERAALAAEVEFLKAELERERRIRPPADPIIEALYVAPLTFAGLQQRLGLTVDVLEPRLARLMWVTEQVERLQGDGQEPRYQLAPERSAVAPSHPFHDTAELLLREALSA